jgi:hypothetical protein
MLYKGVFITLASGKVGGSVWSHNRGGPYIRANGTPTGGPSAEQTDLRAAMTTEAAAWAALSEDQRQAWHRHSRANPRVNRIGDPRVIGGRQEFLRANVVRTYARTWLGAGFPAHVTDPPDDQHGETPLTPPTVDPISGSDGSFNFNFRNADPWHTTNPGYLFVYVSDAQPLTVNWFRGPYTLVGTQGSVTGTPGTYNLPSAAVSSTKLFFRFRASDDRGQLSMPTQVVVVVS